MDSKNTTPNATGFYIWFDKEHKKEYYSTPLVLYKSKICKSKSSKYSYVSYTENYLPKVSPKRNKAQYVKHALKLHLIDLYNPYEERFGAFLINFLNTRTDTWQKAYKDFFFAYGFDFIADNKRGKKLKIEYEDETDFTLTANSIYKYAKEDIIKLQTIFRNCVDYMYNLNNNNEDKEFNPYIKYKAYAIKNNMNMYAQNIDVVMDSLSIFKNDFVNIKLNELTKNINNGNINFQSGAKYSSLSLSNICYVVLNEIASNNITIKTCKNCGRYFIPVNRHAEVYCDLTPIGNNKKCRELGARNTYNKSIQEVEGLLVYRRTYQRRLMELSRNSETTEEERSEFNRWKKEAQAKIKAFKSGKIDEETLNKWMRENKDK